MIARLKGVVEEISGSTITLDVHGVGYEIAASQGCLEGVSLGAEATIVIYTDVREDSIRLYGFHDHLERQVFLLLTRVSGVGAKTASDIISRIEKRELLRAIGEGDLTRLQQVKGIGRKTAERIIVELKDQVAEFALAGRIERVAAPTGSGSTLDDAIAALQALGFPRREAEQAVRRVDGVTPNTDPGEIVRQALRFV